MVQGLCIVGSQKLEIVTFMTLVGVSVMEHDVISSSNL